MCPKDQDTNQGQKKPNEVNDSNAEYEKGPVAFKKVSTTKEKEKEIEEKLAAASKSKLIKKSIAKLDMVSNALFLVSFGLIAFVILRYIFYVCYALDQCKSVNWLLVVGVLAILIIFLIIVRFEKTRVKKAISKVKLMRSKRDTSAQLEAYAHTKLKDYVNRVGNLRSQIAEKDIEIKDAGHDLYLIFKSFISEYLQTPKAMSTTNLIEYIKTKEDFNPELRDYSYKLLNKLFKLNYSDVVDEEQLLILADASQKLMIYLSSKR